MGPPRERDAPELHCTSGTMTIRPANETVRPLPFPLLKDNLVDGDCNDLLVRVAIVQRRTLGEPAMPW